MKTVIAIALCLVPVVVLAGEVYQYKDESGNTVFTDQPRPGATKIRVPEPSTYTPPKLPPYAVAKPKPQEALSQYTSLTLVQPEPEATIWDNTGTVPVSFALQPGLRGKQGHRMVVVLNGNPMSPVAATRVELKNIDRGEHQLQAQIVDAGGRVLIESDTATIYLHKQSTNFPNRTPAPPPTASPPPPATGGGGGGSFSGGN